MNKETLPRAVNAKGFEIQSYVMLEGWLNTFKNLDGTPLIFSTREEAEAELKELKSHPIELRIGEAL